MFSSISELPTHLLNPSPADAPRAAFGKAVRFGGGIFDWFRQEITAGDLKCGKNGVGVPCEWSPDGKTEGKESGGEDSPERSFRSAYPGAYGTYLNEAVAGKADDEFVERPELKVHKMAMVGSGESGMMAEYDGIDNPREFP